MINKIIDGISISLNAEFGDNYKIYTESIEQGLKEPCFSIICVNPTKELFRDKKYFRRNLFCIQYFPKNEDKYAECMDVQERMFDCLEVIKVGDNLQRGASMHGEIVDQVLNFFVNYDMFIYKVESTDAMETMDLTSNVEGAKAMTKKKDEAYVLKFSKEQIVASKKYSPYKDFFNGNLKTGQVYSEAELDELIAKNFEKGTGE